MNYLAHLFLAGTEPEAQLGGLLGDFVKPGSGYEFTPLIEREIRVHRMIDSYTDAHPIVTAAKLKFRPAARRYAGIILDVYFDHCLAVEWERYSAEDLDFFIQRFYRSLSETGIELPERLRQRVPVMISEDWLGSYRTHAGFELAMIRLSSRLSRGAAEMVSGLADVAAQTDALRQSFHAFFPELQRHVVRARERTSGQSIW
ncbi:MAG: ACP phosphodiesterase [Xanthomonadales bacterium]|jgi:acyl carrier protein phosphodiesterase|nr:ACP phosphodiesterase [Xanthomonadales bacterium]